MSFSILDFVKQHTHIVKEKVKERPEADGESSDDVPDADGWTPMMDKQQVLAFLQLAESLIKQTHEPQASRSKIKVDSHTIVQPLLLYEDSEVLRCTLSLLN